MRSEVENSVQKELRDGLFQLEEKSQRRSLCRVGGINLCSNDYLGLSQNNQLREETIEAVRRAERVGGTGSRLLSGHFAEWEELEAEFATFAGTEAALYFGSGYLANLGLITSLLTKEDLVFSDELNHASIIDGIRLCGARKVIYPHGNLNVLEAELRAHVGDRGRKIVATESVFSMDGDVAHIAVMVGLAERYGASVIVDEAHATAVHGSGGRGIVAGAGLSDRVLGILHTCGKALASTGAFVCGSRLLKEHLINQARTFIFSTAAPPYMAGQVRAGLGLARGMDAQRQNLLSTARNFRDTLRVDGWDVSNTDSQIVPVIVGSNENTLEAAEFLQNEGFAVRAIRPPTVTEGKARLRLSLTSLTKSAELEHLWCALNEWRERRGAHAVAEHA